MSTEVCRKDHTSQPDDGGLLPGQQGSGCEEEIKQRLADSDTFDGYVDPASSDSEDDICYARHDSRIVEARKREKLNVKKENAELKLEISKLDLTIHQLTHLLAEKEEALRDKMALSEDWLSATHGGVNKQGQHVKSELSEQIQQLHTEKKSLKHDIKELQELFIEVDKKSTDFNILEAGYEVHHSM